MVSPSILPSGSELTASGSQFKGISEASGGNGAQNSSSNYPLVQLLSLANEQTLFLLVDASTGWSDTSFTSTPITVMTTHSSGFPIGHALVTVFTNGIPSQSRDVIVGPCAVVAYISNYGSNNVSVLDTSTNRVVAIVLVGNHPLGVALNPTGSRAYVTNEDSNNVSVIDTSSNTVVAIVPVGTEPLGVAVNPAGTFAYVANFNNNTVSVIDTSTNTVVHIVTVGSSPFAFGNFIAGVPCPSPTPTPTPAPTFTPRPKATATATAKFTP